MVIIRGQGKEKVNGTINTFLLHCVELNFLTPQKKNKIQYCIHLLKPVKCPKREIWRVGAVPEL